MLGAVAVLGGGLASGCGRDAAEAAGEVAATQGVLTQGVPIQAVYPTDEVGVVGVVTDAIRARDWAGLKRALMPELGAELEQLVLQDSEEFWLRGAAWVTNAESGVTIRLRADDADTARQWRALLRFGNGAEETVEFSRHEGRLVFAKL